MDQRPWTAGGAGGSRGPQSLRKLPQKAQAHDKRPQSAPTLLRSADPPVRAAMDNWGNPASPDMLRQQMEDRAVADNLGRWKFETGVVKSQFKDLDLLADSSLSELLLKHNQSQRNKSVRLVPSPTNSRSGSAAPSPAHSRGGGSATRGTRCLDDSSTRHVRVMATELDKSIFMPLYQRKGEQRVPSNSSVVKQQRQGAAAAAKVGHDFGALLHGGLHGAKHRGSIADRYHEDRAPVSADPAAVPAIGKLTRYMLEQFGTINAAVNSVNHRHRSRLGREEWTIGVMNIGLLADDAKATWLFLPRGDDDMIMMELLEPFLHLYVGLK